MNEVKRQKQTVYINNKCALPCECHSTITVTADDKYSRRDKVNALLWYFAKANKYQFATYTGRGGVEWANNIRMKSQPIPENLKPIVKMWAAELDSTAEDALQERRESDMESFVVEGLNSAHDKLAAKWGDIDPQVFISEITHYARRWARDCYQENQNLY